jgi:hypothetical protein
MQGMEHKKSICYKEASKIINYWFFVLVEHHAVTLNMEATGLW